MNQHNLTPSGDFLTQNVLTQKQLGAGYYLREDDHSIFIYRDGEQLAVFSLYTTSDIIRQEVNRLLTNPAR